MADRWDSRTLEFKRNRLLEMIRTSCTIVRDELADTMEASTRMEFIGALTAEAQAIQKRIDKRNAKKEAA